MSNHHLRNTKLSLKAKDLLSLILSLPENRDYATKGRLMTMEYVIWENQNRKSRRFFYYLRHTNSEM